MNTCLQIKKWNKALFILSYLLISSTFFAQNERLIIGRTTGELILKKNSTLRVFGFSTLLSRQVSIPGPCIDITVGDTVNIDFWNISQGNPASLICKNITFLQYNENNELLSNKHPIDHMEHGFYSFTAKKSGTYLYYSPENYPFNLQAGMFGTIIVRDKTNNSFNKKVNDEILWCSNEIDTKWHTDAIMNVAHDNLNEEITLPSYHPNYFLINGKRTKKIEGLQSYKHKKDSAFLRLVNAGLYVNEIEFPLNIKPKLIYGAPKNLIKSSKGFKVRLDPGECLELSLVFSKNISKNGHIIYEYIEPESKKVHHKVNIPLFF